MADYYIRSARALDRVLKDECSVKAAASPFPDSGRVLAILINALAYRTALVHAIQQSKVGELEDKVFNLGAQIKGKSKGKEQVDKIGNQKKNKKPDLGFKKRHLNQAAETYPSKEAFLLVLCHDLLFQNRGIQAAKTWPPKVTLEKYRASIHAAMVKLQIRQGKAKISDLRVGALYQELAARIPRWVRINTLLCTRDQVLAWLAENRWTRLEASASPPTLVEKVKDFAVSSYIPGLLAFHPKSTSLLLQTELYKNNWIVLQDLASCFPAYLLDPPADTTVIDATSAPGNKTSHLSAIMHEKHLASSTSSSSASLSSPPPSASVSASTSASVSPSKSPGKVIAFERDPTRFKVLSSRLAAVGASNSSLRPPKHGNKDQQKTAFSSNAQGGGNGNVEPQRKDFLTTDPEEFGDVTHMLLDPSCSGSGIVNRLDWLKEDDDVEGDGDGDGDGENVALGGDSSARLGDSDVDGGGDEAKPLSKRQKRLAQLSAFQVLMIRHAFKYPCLVKVVYSTCSVNVEENEQVVTEALGSPEAKDRGWRLEPRCRVLPQWSGRGLPSSSSSVSSWTDEMADSMIRCTPGGNLESSSANTDASNGFFVAVFVRDSSSVSSSPAKPQASQHQSRKRSLFVSSNDEKDEHTHAAHGHSNDNNNNNNDNNDNDNDDRQEQTAKRSKKSQVNKKKKQRHKANVRARRAGP
ncbi:S-adenosyl-L-methionine-dependent methyltransferase [Testicularia cyperi]|uniref:S-adenosyl-L-methionine-dependent methyltransferase n=1 Tax=Testicularia cyperi TaxID=1882483 RepID=A0A317XI27_9BASI|nr:S-adenosyl-L-methionine-dependent methyltransferase [Testicularia cyperi]